MRVVFVRSHFIFPPRQRSRTPLYIRCDEENTTLPRTNNRERDDIRRDDIRVRSSKSETENWGEEIQGSTWYYPLTVLLKNVLRIKMSSR
jgi:hypothetical protein